MAQAGTLILGQYKVIRVLKMREDYAAVQAVDILDRQHSFRLLNIYEGAAARRYAHVYLDLRHCPEFLGASQTINTRNGRNNNNVFSFRQRSCG